MLICFQNTCTPDNTPETVSEPVSDHKMTSEALDKYDVINRRSKYSAKHKILVVIVCFVISAALAAFVFIMFNRDTLDEEEGDGGQNENDEQIEEEDEEGDWEDYDEEDFDLDDEDDYN